MFKSILLVKNVLKKLAIVLLGREKAGKLFYDLGNADEFASLAYHETMVADSVRVNGYYKGIRSGIQKGDVVVDVGTGTGILSFFAAQKAGKIYAIDHSGILSVAKSIARANNLSNIEFVRTNSKDFKPEEKVDVILHEQIGQCLFGENMVEHLLDLKRRILKPTGRILPSQFELFVEPIVMKSEYSVPFLWDQKIHGVDFSCTRNDPEVNRLKKSSYLLKNARNFEVDYLVAKPEPVFGFDLNKIDSESEIPKSFEMTRTVTRAGAVDGYCIYFRVIFDKDNSFDNAPTSRQTNWWNVIIRVDPRTYHIGDTISYSLNIGTLSDKKTWHLTTKPPQHESHSHRTVRSYRASRTGSGDSRTGVKDRPKSRR